MIALRGAARWDATMQGGRHVPYLGSVAAQRVSVSAKSRGSWPCIEWPMAGNDW